MNQELTVGQVLETVDTQKDKCKNLLADYTAQVQLLARSIADALEHRDNEARIAKLQDYNRIVGQLRRAIRKLKLVEAPLYKVPIRTPWREGVEQFLAGTQEILDKIPDEPTA